MWIYFGYCRNAEVVSGLSRWEYPFDRNKVNPFATKRGLNVKSIHQVLDHMINNHSYIIGGAIVATQKKWKEFYELVCHCQIKTLKNNIVDDQGVFIMCYHYNPQLIKLNYLDKNRWFNLFKIFGKKDLPTLSRRLKVSLIGK